MSLFLSCIFGINFLPLTHLFTRSRIYRIENGECIIGMKAIAMIPLISFDAVVNVYLTILFMIPLRSKSDTEKSTPPTFFLS